MRFVGHSAQQANDGVYRMKYRPFGKSGWQVSEIGYGMWGVGDWTGSDDDESLRCLQLAVDLGCNFFDTAWAYGEGHGERSLAQLISANPEIDIKVAAKTPPNNIEWPSRRQFSLDDCFPPDYVKEFVGKSLQNLDAMRIDLILFRTLEDSWLQDDR